MEPQADTPIEPSVNPPTETVLETQTASSKLSLIIPVVVLLLIAGAVYFVFGRDKTNKTSEVGRTRQNDPSELSLLSSTGLIVDGSRSFKWVLEGGNLVEGSKAIEAKQGEEVAITITAEGEEGETYVTIDDHTSNTEVLHSNGFGLLTFNAEKLGTYTIRSEVFYEGETHENGEHTGIATISRTTVGTIEVKAN